MIPSFTMVEYDEVVNRLFTRFAEDVYPISDSTAFVKTHPEYALKVKRAAEQILDSGSQWGALIPGVGIDCLGSIITVGCKSGLYRIPKGVLASLGSQGMRNNELAKSPYTLHRRLTRMLLIMVEKYCHENTHCIPVENPKQFYPGDIFYVPHIVQYNGVAMLPHLTMSLGGQEMLSSNPGTGTVVKVDVKTMNYPIDMVQEVYRQKNRLFIFRLVDGPADDLAKQYYKDLGERLKNEEDRHALDYRTTMPNFQA
nr:MAG TPA: hypothetical protein [Caudoviricetes sp.]